MKKIVIIGAGEIGQRALEFVGAECVAYFADNKKAGGMCCDKAVYPVEKAAGERGQYVLLLALTKYRKELTKQLRDLGVCDFYDFDDDIYLGNIFQGCGLPLAEKVSLYDGIQSVSAGAACVYGDKRKIGRFVADVMEIPCAAESGEKGYRSLERLAEEYTYIFINTENYTEELMEKCKALHADVCFIAKYYDTDYYQKNRLMRYRGIHRGKRCFIIGNGPSLRMEDLDVLARHKEICFGLNLIHMAYQNTDWRPDYICVSDTLTLQKNAEKIIEHNQCPIFIADSFLRFQGDACVEERILPFRKVYPNEANDFEISFAADITEGICNANSVAYYALQIAAYMGFAQIYLLGMDNSDWAFHFAKDYLLEADTIRDNYDEALESLLISLAFQKAEEVSNGYHFKIYNATRGGYLETHERVEFDQLFAG